MSGPRTDAFKGGVYGLTGVLGALSCLVAHPSGFWHSLWRLLYLLASIWLLVVASKAYNRARDLDTIDRHMSGGDGK